MENAAPAVVGESLFSPEEKKALHVRIINAKISDELYLRKHPEVSLVLGEAIRQCLARRPEHPVNFTEDFLASQDLHVLHEELVRKQTA